MEVSHGPLRHRAVTTLCPSQKRIVFKQLGDRWAWNRAERGFCGVFFSKPLQGGPLLVINRVITTKNWPCRWVTAFTTPISGVVSPYLLYLWLVGSPACINGLKIDWVSRGLFHPKISGVLTDPWTPVPKNHKNQTPNPLRRNTKKSSFQGFTWAICFCWEIVIPNPPAVEKWWVPTLTADLEQIQAC